MKSSDHSRSKFFSFKIVLFYAAFSAIYIYTSDYFLKLFTNDIERLSSLQTYKGWAFILITSLMLFFLVKRYMDSSSNYFQQIIEVQQQSDTQLLRSQEAYMSLFNHSPIPMWIIDFETLDFLLVNEAACTVYGFTQEEYAHMNLKDIRHLEDIDTMNEMLKISLNNTNFSVPQIVQHKKKNGQIIQVKVKTSILTFNDKKVRLASAIDVTAEVDIQHQLIEINSKLQMASEIASLGYWTNDLGKSEIQWSDEMFKIFEIDPNAFELNLPNIIAHFHPEDQMKFEQNVYSKFEQNPISEVEQRIVTPTGKVKWILERQFLIKDQLGKPIKLQGIALDITRSKLHEQELSESNERFEILAKATVEAIIDWDIKNKKVSWGEGFHTVLGYDLSTCDNKLWSKNIHPSDREKVLDELYRTMNDPKETYFNSEFRFLKANGEIAYVQHKGVFIRDADGKAIRALGAMIDLTESLARLHKIEVQHQALKDISWTQSHLVRAPLANLMGLVSLMKDKRRKHIDDDMLVHYISDSAAQLDVIIREIVRKSSEVEAV